MKIFISWSKENSTSHKVATALHEWLPDIIQGVEPWMSTHDIQSGELWGSAVSKQLEANSYGILSITPLSMNAPWLIFEAGALAKFVDTSRVCPYLSNMAPVALTGPLTQLQSRVSNKEGTFKLVQDINKHLENPILEDRLQRSFERCWAELENKLISAYKNDDIGDLLPIKRPESDILEEILNLTRKMSRGNNSLIPASSQATISIPYPVDDLAEPVFMEYANQLQALKEKMEKLSLQGDNLARMGKSTEVIDDEITRLVQTYNNLNQTTIKYMQNQVCA